MRLTSTNPKTSVLKLGNSNGLILALFLLFSLLSAYLLPDFQIALTHSIFGCESSTISRNVYVSSSVSQLVRQSVSPLDKCKVRPIKGPTGKTS